MFEEYVTGRKIHRDLSDDELYSNSDEDDINTYIAKQNSRKMKLLRMKEKEVKEGGKGKKKDKKQKVRGIMKKNLI